MCAELRYVSPQPTLMPFTRLDDVQDLREGSRGAGAAASHKRAGRRSASLSIHATLTLALERPWRSCGRWRFTAYPLPAGDFKERKFLPGFLPAVLLEVHLMERGSRRADPEVQDNILGSIPVRLPSAPAERVVVYPIRVAEALAAVALCLVVMSIVTGATGVGDEYFGLNVEESVPTYFSTIILLIASGLLAFIAVLKRRRADLYSRYWALLSLIFLYLSLDEAARLHEMTEPRISRFADLSGPFYYASTVFTLALVLIVSATFFRFVLHLPPKTGKLFVAAAALYVGGALGLEMVGSTIDESAGTAGAMYQIVTTLEETLEMAGVVLFIYALLHYLAVELHGPRLQVTLQPDGEFVRLGGWNS